MHDSARHAHAALRVLRCRPATVLPTSAKDADDGPETKLILTDADFVDVKLTQVGA